MDELPDELPPRELFRRLELGLMTLRDQCLARNENDVDQEIGARYAQLHELWHWGRPVEPAAVTTPSQDKRRTLPVGKIASRCSELLRRIAEEKREELGG
jgi:hypothetical protein